MTGRKPSRFRHRTLDYPESVMGGRGYGYGAGWGGGPDGTGMFGDGFGGGGTGNGGDVEGCSGMAYDVPSYYYLDPEDP